MTLTNTETAMTWDQLERLARAHARHAVDCLHLAARHGYRNDGLCQNAADHARFAAGLLLARAEMEAAL